VTVCIHDKILQKQTVGLASPKKQFKTKENLHGQHSVHCTQMTSWLLACDNDILICFSLEGLLLCTATT